MLEKKKENFFYFRIAIYIHLILFIGLNTFSVVGAILIIIGLYAILWGKKKEEEKFEVEHCVSEQDIEIRPEK